MIKKHIRYIKTKTIKKQVSIGGVAEDVYVSGSIAYLADINHGLAIIDVSDPANPTKLGQFDDDNGRAYDVYVSDTIAYVAERGEGLEIIDVSNPTSPTELGQFDDGGNVQGVYVNGNIAYVADFGEGLVIIGGILLLTLSLVLNPGDMLSVIMIMLGYPVYLTILFIIWAIKVLMTDQKQEY